MTAESTGPPHPALPLVEAPRAERRGLLLLVASAAVLVAGTFLPWLRSGTVWRTSYQVWQSADRLGVVEGRPAETLHLLWFLLPLGATFLLVAVALDRPRLAALVAVVMGVLGLVGAAVAWASPLPTGAGPVVTLIGAVGVLGAAVGNLAHLRRRPSR